ncbi:lysophospholipid acyltransferase family protein [Malacoplasma iowae]|uniref:lysophospholipid acyltransferase family protein n=1 Tax=Malacoplasma iowae TaxID=2116 RepID=UPI003872C2D8|nr:lysophospholipid acyltransferase family protein [Malacoplasma iowae]
MNAKVFFTTLWNKIAFPFSSLSLLIGLSRSKKKYLTYESEPEDLPESERYTHVFKLSRRACFVTNTKVKLEGLDKVPNVPVLFICNHKSSFDPVILLKIFSEKQIKPVFVSKKEVLDNKKVGFAARLINTIFMDRKNLRDVYRCIQEEKAVLKNKSVVVFIEGTRIKSDNFGEFRGAALEPSYATMRSIVPVVIYGTKSMEESNKKQLLKYKEVTVKFLEPIKYKEFIHVDKQVFANKIKDLMFNEYRKIAEERKEELNLENIEIDKEKENLDIVQENLTETKDNQENNQEISKIVKQKES